MLGKLGIVVLFVGVIMFFLIIRPQQHEANALKAEAQKVKARVDASKLAKTAAPSLQTRLTHFYQRFPAASTAPDLLDKIYTSAKTQNLSLEQGEYRWVHQDNDKLMRFEAVLPVKGSYVQIRKFLNQLLVELPNLTVDDISFQRQRVSDAIVQSQIKVSLYLEEGK